MAATLHQALKDAAYGPLRDKLDARRFIDGPVSKRIAELIDINDWPPKQDCYDRLRREHRDRYF